MNILNDILFTLVYITLIFYFGFIDLESDNYILQKSYLFIFLFIFFIVMEVIKKLKQKCTYSNLKIFTHALSGSIAGIIGLAIYTDLTNMSLSKEKMISFSSNNLIKTLIVISSVLIPIFFYKLFDVSFKGSECDDII